MSRNRENQKSRLKPIKLIFKHLHRLDTLTEKLYDLVIIAQIIFDI